MINAAEEAESNNTCIQGIFKVSPLAPILDLVESIPVDYMHCV